MVVRINNWGTEEPAPETKTIHPPEADATIVGVKPITELSTLAHY